MIRVMLKDGTKSGWSRIIRDRISRTFQRVPEITDAAQLITWLAECEKRQESCGVYIRVPRDFRQGSDAKRTTVCNLRIRDKPSAGV